jgi:hypothetical protein
MFKINSLTIQAGCKHCKNLRPGTYSLTGMDDSWGIFFGNGLMVPAMMNVIDSFFWHISCHDTYPQTTSNIVHEKYIGKFG